MKTGQIFLMTGIIVATLAMTACSPSRGYYSQSYPRSRNSFSLIISPTPGFAMSRYPDGRYYYRSPEGYMYWRGNDNRFYLDRQYLGRVHYEQREYNEWRRYDRNSSHRRRR